MFHYKGRGYAVCGLKTIAPLILAVGVQIDETWRDDKTSGIDFLRSSETIFADPHYCAVGDAEVADTVEVSLRIHYSTVFDYEIKGGRLSYCAEHEQRAQE